jgi:hypothetical protein
MKQRAEITFETEERVVLREGSEISVYYCAACGKDVLMATPQAAALLSGISEREIFRSLEANLLHFTENGRVMICLNSARAIREKIDL